MTRPLTPALPPPYTADTEDATRFNRYRFTLSRDEQIIGRGTHFTGGNHIKPWLELQPVIAFDPENEEHRALFDALTGVLEPGSHLMIHYLQDTETAAALTADVPPPATSVGFLLWHAGVRWFKDWYFTEGWMEGDQKLQGNLPLDADVKEKREAEWRDTLNAFLSRETAYSDCQHRARELIASL